MDDQQLAQAILDLIGGTSNIRDYTHCVTRLRVTVHDKAIIDQGAIQKLAGVMGVNNVGSQFQVILGGRVTDVYNAFSQLVGENESGTDSADEQEHEGWVSRFLDLLSGIFVPILPAIIGAGLLKGLMILLMFYKIVATSSDTYKILTVFSDSAFYFLPILLAVSSANKFKTNKFVAMAIAGILVHPDMVAMMANHTSVHFFGIPFTSATYSSSVLPIILGVWVMSYIERWLNRIIPQILRTVLVPLFTLLITAPIILAVLGPIGTIVGDGLANGFITFYMHFGMLAGATLGAAYPFLVLLGMHVGFTPVMVQSISKYGFDYIMGVGVASNSAQAGATTAVYLKTKNPDFKTIAGSSALNAIIGVTEPALFGVTSKLKRPLIAVSAGGAVGGAIAGFFHVKSTGVGTGPIAGIPLFLGSTFIYFIIACVVSYFVGLGLAWVIGFDDVPVKQAAPVDPAEVAPELVANQTIMTPIAGEVVPLASVNDNVFSQKMMGDGIAIKPTRGEVVAPFDGVVQLVFETKHAVGLKSYDGCEVLIHVGLDTVELKGQYFESNVEQGQAVKQGEPLLHFDIDKIKAAGYDPTSMIIITNTASYQMIDKTSAPAVTANEQLLQVSI